MYSIRLGEQNGARERFEVKINENREKFVVRWLRVGEAYFEAEEWKASSPISRRCNIGDL